MSRQLVSITLDNLSDLPSKCRPVTSCTRPRRTFRGRWPSDLAGQPGRSAAEDVEYALERLLGSMQAPVLSR